MLHTSHLSSRLPAHWAAALALPTLLTFALSTLSCGQHSSSRTLPAASPSQSRLRHDVTTLAAFGTRHTLSDTTSTTRGIGAARTWLHAEFSRIAAASGNRLKVEYQEVPVNERSERITAPITLVNVLATLPGTLPPEQRKVIIVSGHYDSRAKDVMNATIDAPGANDDASGTALVLELARHLAGKSFNHTLVFAAVAGEEQGLTGAAGLAAKAKAESWPVIAMITNDIVGNSTGGSGLKANNRVRVFSEGVPTAETPGQIQNRQSLGGESDGPSRQLSRYIAEVADRDVKGFKVVQTFRRDRYARGGDHIPFLRQGYAAVRITEAYENFERQHADLFTNAKGETDGDLPQHVDYAYLANVARVNLAVLTALASAPPPPSRVAIDSGLSYDTTLSWDPPSPAAPTTIAGYRIRYRDTTAPTWQHAQTIPGGATTRATLKNISKDDYQFAVETYDASGNTSVPLVPNPRRR